jgi:hypothetical protein
VALAGLGVEEGELVGDEDMQCEPQPPPSAPDTSAARPRCVWRRPGPAPRPYRAIM